MVQGPSWCHSDGGGTREGQEQSNAQTWLNVFRRAEQGHGHTSAEVTPGEGTQLLGNQLTSEEGKGHTGRG